MNENLNYISDEALEQLMLQVEQDELMAAPPDLMEHILEAAGLCGEAVPKVVPVKPAAVRKKEFYAYCFRVITSVAAAIALVFLLPELTGRMEPVGIPSQEHYDKSAVVQAVPSYEKVIGTVPSREEVVYSEQTPTKAEVLNDTGLIERVLNNTGWFSKQNSEK